MQLYVVESLVAANLYQLQAHCTLNDSSTLCRYAHFGKDQINTTQPRKALVIVKDTEYTLVPDSETIKMVAIVETIRNRFHSKLCSEYRFVY